MNDKLSFPAFTHDSIAGYCNGSPLYAQYKNDKKSKYIGTKQMWQELSKLRWDLENTTKALSEIYVKTGDIRAKTTIEQIEHKE